MDYYLGKALGDYSTEELKNILLGLEHHHNNREAARPMFSQDRQVKGAKVKKIQFPPPNPNFIKLKVAIENELALR